MPANYRSQPNEHWKTNKSNRLGNTTPSLGQFLNSQSGTTYTIQRSDLNSTIMASNASAVTITIPPYASTPFDLGARIDVCQYGTGQVTIAPGSGVTLRSTPTLKTRAQYSTLSCIKIATNEWLIVGDLASF